MNTNKSMKKILRPKKDFPIKKLKKARKKEKEKKMKRNLVFNLRHKKQIFSDILSKAVL